MFNKTQQYNAYNMASQTVPKTRQVVMLYYGATRFLKQARQAIDENRIEDRFHLLNKASEVIVGLQACLDFENGGEIAQILFDYYSSIDARILYVQRKNDGKILDAVIAEVKKMRDAWYDIDEKGEEQVMQNGTVAYEEGDDLTITSSSHEDSAPTGTPTEESTSEPTSEALNTDGLYVSV